MSSFGFAGFGRNRDRTCDIRRVKTTLYRLSYPPAGRALTRLGASCTCFFFDPSRAFTIPDRRARTTRTCTNLSAPWSNRSEAG